MAAEWVSQLIAAGSGLLGVGVGAALNLYAEGRRRHAEFVARQLNEFYGPLLGLHAAIRAHTQLRLKIGDAQDATWRDLVQEAREDGGVDAIQRLREGPLGVTYRTMIDEEERHFKEGVFPFYRDMVRVFREHIALADPDTRQHLPALIEYVEVWERWFRGVIPGQVTQAIGHSERNLHPFYRSIEEVHDRLRKQLGG
jgi:hypothetical protein